MQISLDIYSQIQVALKNLFIIALYKEKDIFLVEYIIAN